MVTKYHIHFILISNFAALSCLFIQEYHPFFIISKSSFLRRLLTSAESGVTFYSTWFIANNFQGRRKLGRWSLSLKAGKTNPSICLHFLILHKLKYISSLMNLIFSPFQTWILQATASRKVQTLKKNLVHQTRYVFQTGEF